MSSTDKTSILGLSKWRGTDRPKRVDFVNDNELIDAALGGHINNADLHVGEDAVHRLREPIYIKTHAGTGAAEKVIMLDFEPCAVAVFAVGKPPAALNGNTVKVYSAFAVNEQNSAGIELFYDELRLIQNASASGGVQNCLNETGVTYVILAFR